MERRLDQELEELALELATASGDDPRELAGILERLEALCGRAPQELRGTLEELRQLLERTILEEVPAEEGLRRLREGLARCQEALRARPPGGVDRELLSGFLQEAREQLQEAEVQMVALEQRPSDQEALNAVFRAFHTIKGVAGFLGLSDVQRLAHAAEDLLGRLREGTLRLTRELADLVLEAIDGLRSLLDALQRGETTAGIPLDELVERLRRPPREGRRLGEILVERGVAAEEVEQGLELQRRDPTRRLGEILVERGAASPQEVTEALREQRRHAVRVDTEKLDALVDMVGELVVVQSLIRHSPALRRVADQRLQHDLGQLQRITAELQRTSMSLRMEPLAGTFRRMVRLVRDLARRSGKEVALRTSGEDTEIDRNVVEEVHDALVHLVRNAVDHGLEPPEERRRAGKPPTGTIWLRAYHRAGNTVIEVADDGRGLDRDRILRRAREQGLVGETAEPSDPEVWQLIFLPGFSTAERVTDVSGRGVGMDVVKHTVERLGGRVEVRSQPGRGTTFVLSMPLTLAIIDGVIVRVGAQRYVVPATAVREFLQLSPSQCVASGERVEMVRIREEVMPLVRLHHLFGADDGRPPWEHLGMVAEAGGRCRCLLVDELVGKQEVVIKGLEGVFWETPWFAGGAILGDGRVGLILDLNGIFEAADQRGCGP